MSGHSRRDLLKGALALPLAAQVKTAAPKPERGSRPVVIASANGLRAVEKAYSVLAAGGDPLDAVISGVNIVEDVSQAPYGIRKHSSLKLHMSTCSDSFGTLILLLFQDFL